MEEEVFIPGEPVLASKKATREAGNTGGFTPGPLVYGDCSMDDPSPGPKWEVYIRHKGATAYCWKKADARLYAAAPELLAALQSLAEVSVAAIRAEDWRVDGAADPDLALIRARNAIAKALGRDRPEGSAQSAPEGPGRTT